MKFRYEFEIKKPEVPIHHRHKIFLIGSCFTENIGEKLSAARFNIMQNPNGILFNPVSVSEALISYVENVRYGPQDLFHLNEGWHSWKHHSRYSSPDQSQSLEKINDSIGNAHKFLKQADFIFITLGSAWVYTLTGKAEGGQYGQVAANNHKAPADWFHRRLLSVEEVLSTLDLMVHRLKLFNSDLNFIFTISPVRHLREGAIENNRSKAVLIQAVHQIVAKFEGMYYFPAYELVIDDLRDYRFFAEDLVHPNYFATQYVWEKLIGACFTEQSQKLIEELGSIQLAVQHKPFNPASAQHRKFLQTYFQKVQALSEKCPYIDLEKEKKYFESGLADF